MGIESGSFIPNLMENSRVVLPLVEYNPTSDPERTRTLSFHIIIEMVNRGYLPPQLCLVILTRSDPPLPLARLRAGAALVELREPDLRFTLDEAETLLNQVAGLDLDQVAITTLERRTEGWAVGLQLAGLAMQGRADVSAFIAVFARDHTYIIDYLTDEVFQRQSEEV